MFSAKKKARALVPIGLRNNLSQVQAYIRAFHWHSYTLAQSQNAPRRFIAHRKLGRLIGLPNVNLWRQSAYFFLETACRM
jgi:hypothetical protein